MAGIRDLPCDGRLFEFYLLHPKEAQGEIDSASASEIISPIRCDGVKLAGVEEEQVRRIVRSPVATPLPSSLPDHSEATTSGNTPL
jgi:hypothetical protein